MQQVVIIGAGGHSKVVADIVQKSGAQIVGFLDDKRDTEERILGFPILGKVDAIPRLAEYGYMFVIAIGDNNTRRSLASRYDIAYYTAIHPQAIIGSEVSIGEGTVVMAGAIVNSGTQIGKHCILNTSCVVEHDNIVGDFAHICPRSVLAGTVSIGEATQLGVGSTVSNNISICANCLIGAGAVVISDINIPGTYVGVPAHIINKFH